MSGSSAGDALREEFSSASKQMAVHLHRLQVKINDVTKSLSDNREIKERYLDGVKGLRGAAIDELTTLGVQSIDHTKALTLARRASEVFDDPAHFKSARASYDFVMSIGGVDKIKELEKKSQAINEHKLDDSLLDYRDLLSKYKITVGSIIMVVWSCGSKSFVMVLEQFSNVKCSTSICLRLLVDSKKDMDIFAVVPISTIDQHCTVAFCDNLQKLFEEVCDVANIKKLYHSYTSSTPVASRYSECEFARVVAQQSREGIEKSPGLANILAPCGTSTSNKQGKMPVNTSSSGELAGAPSQAGPVDDSDDDDPVFVEERTREERDRLGRLNAICLE